MDAYATVATSTIDDIIAEILAFAVANGWSALGTGDDILHDGGECYTRIFRTLDDDTDDDSIRVIGGTGIDSGELVGVPGGGRYGCIRDHTMLGTAFHPQGTLHMFAHDDPMCVYAVLNYQTDHYHWITFGTLVKYGGWGGGQFFSATEGEDLSNSQSPGIVDVDGVTRAAPGALFAPCVPGGSFASEMSGGSFVRVVEADIDSPNPPWLHTNQVTSTSSQYKVGSWNRQVSLQTLRAGRGILDLIQIGPNAWNGQVVLLPVKPQCARPSGLRSILGHAPGIWYASIQNHAPQDVITVGETDYMLFPWWHKAPQAGTRHFGFALELPED